MTQLFLSTSSHSTASVICFKASHVLIYFSVAFWNLCRCFMEYQVLAEFVRLLKISRSSRIEAPLLQYLSIMIQNMDSDHAICNIPSSKIHMLTLNVYWKRVLEDNHVKTKTFIHLANMFTHYSFLLLLLTTLMSDFDIWMLQTTVLVMITSPAS